MDDDAISRPIVDWVIKKSLFIFVLSDVILSRHQYSTKTYPNIFTRLLFKIQSQLCDWCLVTLGPNKCKNNFTTSYKTSFVKNYSASQFTPLIHFQNIQALVSVVSLNSEYKIHTEWISTACALNCCFLCRCHWQMVKHFIKALR